MVSTFVSTINEKLGILTAPAPPERAPFLASQNSENSSDHSVSQYRDIPSSHPSVISKPAGRDALELVPKFDGHNIPVLQFVRACKRAKELIPPLEESAFLRFLRGKLIGHAYLSIEDEPLETVEQMLKSLKRTFSPARTPNFYRGQLSALHKNPNEHILDYIGRVKDLRGAIIEGDQAVHGRDLTRREVLLIDADVADSFFEGLPPEYRAEMRTDECKTPTEAYNKAITVAKRLERDRTYSWNARIEQGPRMQPQDPRFFPPAPRSAGIVAREPPPVNILQRDHYYPPAYNPRTPRHNRDTFPTKRCSYCNNLGHLVSECRKRQANNNNTYRVNQGNAPAASAMDNRGRSSHQTALPLQENPLPSTSSNPPTGASPQ